MSVDLGEAQAFQELVSMVTSGVVGYPTWAELNPIDRPSGSVAEVDLTDTGTHVDPVTTATVPNTGRYRKAAAGWTRISSLAADSAAQAEQAAANAIIAVAFAEVQGQRSQAVIYSTSGIGAGAYPIEFSSQSAVTFTRAYGKVWSGTGTCRVRMLDDQGTELWSNANQGNTASDVAISQTLTQGRDLSLVVDNIQGEVFGLVVKLEA